MIHSRIRDYYHDHVQVYDQYLRNTTPYLGVNIWQSFFEGNESDTSVNDQSSSCEELCDRASFSVEEDDASCLDANLSNDGYSRSSCTHLSVKIHGYPPAELSTNKLNDISARLHVEVPLVTRDGDDSVERAKREGLHRTMTGLYQKPKPIADSLGISTLLKLFPSNRKSKAPKKKGSEINTESFCKTVREAWRVWALRRGIRPVLGIYKRPGEDAYLLISGLRNIDIPESKPGIRHEMDMLSFVQRAHLLYPQESHHTRGAFCKELRIKRIAAMLVLVVYALHQEGVAHGSLVDLRSSIVLQFNEYNRCYYPVVHEFVNCAMATEEELQSLGEGVVLIDFKSVFAMRAVDDWHGVAIAIATMFIGSEYYETDGFRGSPAVTSTFESGMRNAGASEEAISFVAMLLRSELYGAGILVDQWLVGVDWKLAIDGIH
eukprot:GHVH01016203.1.p1 GENE.GHVH01016203.1~~GHVH01016203.1.p1  ORF type:complete len:434 (+),score=62.30 GHVH01016203.1:1188-2489(+)